MTIDDRIDLGTADQLIEATQSKRESPYATCPVDDEPLIGTIEFDNAEFVCVICGSLYGFLAPKPAKATPELAARYDELRERYRTERAAREAARKEQT